MTVIVSGGGSGPEAASGAALTIPSPPPSPKEVPEEGPTRSGQIMRPSSAGASATGAIPVAAARSCCMLPTFFATRFSICQRKTRHPMMPQQASTNTVTPPKING